MNVYIAYKFSNVQNKQALREDVQMVSNFLEQKGHNTFLLGRDLQKWQDFTHSMPKKMKTILKELKRADCIFAYVNSPVFSKGLLFELFWAKVFRKKIVVAIRQTVDNPLLEKVASKVYRYKTVKDVANFDCI